MNCIWHIEITAVDIAVVTIVLLTI